MVENWVRDPREASALDLGHHSGSEVKGPVFLEQENLTSQRDQDQVSWRGWILRDLKTQ